MGSVIVWLLQDQCLDTMEKVAPQNVYFLPRLSQAHNVLIPTNIASCGVHRLHCGPKQTEASNKGVPLDTHTDTLA